MNFKITKTIFIVFVFSLLATISVHSTEYYIAKNGDNNGPGTFSNPWKTIAKANSTLQPGDIVYIRAGVYSETISPSRSGTPGNHITYKAYPGEIPVIDCSQLLTNWTHYSGVIYWTNYSGNAVGLWEDTFAEANYYCGSWPVYSLSNLDGPGKYYQDTNNKRFYVWTKNGDNPNNHTMRTSVGRGATISQDYIVIDGIHMKWVQVGVKLGNSNNCILQNLDIQYTYGGMSSRAGAHHNKILNNVIFHIGSWYWDEGDGIHIEGHHHLIDGNDISLTGHAGISTRGLKSTGSTPHHNIIQNNNVHECGSSALNSNWSCYREIWRNNIASRSTGAGIQTDGNHLAWYNNIFYENGASGGVYTSEGRIEGNNKFFNNTFFNNNSLYLDQPQQVPDNDEWTISESKTGGVNDNNVFKNNIIYNNAPTTYKNYSIWCDQFLKNNVLVYNNFFGPNQGKLRVTSIGINSLSWWESNYPSNFNNNLQRDPVFVDAGNNDFNLQSGSRLVDAGTFLTRTTSPGNGTTIYIEDAGYFCDGFGIMESDLIQLEGQTDNARIISVDYNNHIITVDKALTWRGGQGVSLPYNGSAPDIGAFEYGGVSPLYANATASPTSGQIPLTVNFTGIASGGIPPYNYSWNFGDQGSSNEQNPTHTYIRDQSYTAILTVTDNDGNQDNDSVTINTFTDTRPPTGTISINSGAATTYSTLVTLTLSATDDQSGMGPGAEMKFSNDNVNWTDPEPYGTAKSWTLAGGDGVKTVYVNYKDAAGNWMSTPVSDDIVLDTSVSGYLIHNTFEQQLEGWGGAISNTGYERDNSTSYVDNYSMHVYSTGSGSKLSIGVNLVGWSVDQYPFLSVAYKVPNNVPVGIFFNTDAGWICLGGSKNHDSGGYPVNDAYTLVDDNLWHLITLNVRDKIREVFPSANTVLEFEWYTQNNGQQGDEFWFDEVMISADNSAPPTASISLSDPSPTKAGTVEVTLATSKNVIKIPSPLIFNERDNSTTTIDLKGSVPGTTFTGTFNVDDTVAEGVGYFSLPTDALLDEEGNTGNKIISGAYVRIDRTSPSNPQNLTVGNIIP